MGFPTRRMRRLRRSGSMRRLIQETKVTPDDLVCPVFVQEGLDERRSVGSMSGIYRIPPDVVEEEVGEIYDLGIPAIMLFGIPQEKDDVGSSARDDGGVVQQAVRAARKARQDMVVMADVCMCQYTSTGHCGILSEGTVDNDSTIAALGDIAVSYARAGVDVVSPSAMMDGQVAAIRSALDRGGFTDVGIMSHAAKHRSSLYSPFRDAADCAPKFGDRRSYQVPYTNFREAMMEVQTDIEEGVDIVMIKPALTYLDLVAEARRRFDVPVAAYSVSGEYALVKAAHMQGWVDGAEVTREILGSIKRAGADIIVTYFAKDAARMAD